MADEMGFVIETLRSHASRVDGVVDQLNVAVDASQQVTMDNDAYGILCRPFAWMIDAAESHGVDTLKRAVEALQETADTLRDTAEEYQSVEDGNMERFDGIQA